ncbi:MAG: D-cysteine desulfhydrase [Pseudomonadota bacterium]
MSKNQRYVTMAEQLSSQLESFPRSRLAHLPTPLEFLPRLTKHLGGPDIYVKRDDCTGLGSGGNKTRKLEFVMAEAIAAGATVVITQGAVQSNHARQTAAAACKLGLRCELLFENRVSEPEHDYLNSGNVLLDRMFGAAIRHYPKGTDMNDAMTSVADEWRAKGETPFVIPGGASNTTGALGYVDCARELLVQADEIGIPLDHVVHATGSAGTQAGLVAGFRVSGSAVPVLGIGVNAPQDVQEARVFDLACKTASLLGSPDAVAREDVVADCNYIGDGYGISTPAMVEAVLLLARLEGLLFDPVYSGKALAGFIDLVGQGHFSSASSVVFLHTGGAAALFAYNALFSAEA